MYEAYYNLSANPFRLAPDQKFFYESACHRRGLSYLRYGLHQSQGFVVVTGIPGTGKSLLVQTLFSELADRRMVIATLNNPNLCDLNILRAVANCFDVHYPEDNKAGLLGAIERFLINQRRAGKHVLLIVDEAQNLPKKSLEELRMLTNFQCKEQALIQIMLLGQQQLQQVLSDPTMEQLTQRIIASCHLAPLNAMDMRFYIEHRLKVVGWQGRPSFTVGALRLIHHYSRGIPRLINNLCDRLLLSASLDEKDEINREHVEAIIEELRSEASGAWVQESSPPLDCSTAADLTPLPDRNFVPPTPPGKKNAANNSSAPVARSVNSVPASNGQAAVALESVVEAPSTPKRDEVADAGQVVTPDYVAQEEELLGASKKRKGKRRKKDYSEHGPSELLDDATFKPRSKKQNNKSKTQNGNSVGSVVDIRPEVSSMVSGNDEHVVPELPNESGVITPSYENEEEESPKTKGGFLSFLNKGQKEKTTTKDEGEVPADRKPSNAHVSLPIETKNIGGLQSINASVEKMEIASVPTFAESVAEDARDSSTGSLVFEDDDSDTSKVGAMRQRAQPNTKAAGRWWVMPAVAALLVIVAMAIFIFLAEKDGGPLHKVFSPMIGGAGHSSVVEPGLVSTQLDVAVVKEPIIPVVTSNHVAPDNALSLSSYGVVKDDAPVETVEPVSIVNDVPPEVVEPIQQHELPELIYSFSFAYENGDLNQFVGLFSNDAKVDEAQGKVSITNEYREFFQATDMRNMDIKELTWQPEGGKAKGQGDFELTVWRGGNIAPATIKGKIDIEVIKTQERLYIQKLSMATR